jgi:signal transduction histidine kinase
MASLLLGLIGEVDYVTGHDFGLSAFYLLPIGWVCWVAGRRMGVLFAAASAVVWLVADLASDFHYSNWAIPYWNAAMLLVLSVCVVLLLAASKDAVALKEEFAGRKRAEQARLQAERLATVGIMAAQVAHEVRNPLGSVTLNLDLIDKEIARLAETSGHPAKEAHVLVQEIRGEVHRIRRVIDIYLQFGRLPKPEWQPLAINALLEQKLAFMVGTFDQARVKLRTEFDPALAAIRGDEDLIWEAALNLIKNSIEAMPDGGELCVSTARAEKQALLRFTDTGAGMNPERLAMVFQPFFTTKKQGTGVGLTLVQQIVTEHGGHVECTSVEGRGSTFTIVLPLSQLGF